MHDLPARSLYQLCRCDTPGITAHILAERWMTAAEADHLNDVARFRSDYTRWFKVD